MTVPLALAVAIAVAITATAAAQTSRQGAADLAKLLPLRASIYGTPLIGARETVPVMVGQNEAQQVATFRAAMRPVRMGESFQLTVELVRPSGNQPVASDPRTKYEPNGCLIVSPQGFVTITQDGSSDCTPGHVSELRVMMVDAQQIQAWNRYTFKIVE